MRVKMLICAVARGKQITIPTGSFTLEEGDTIYLMATPQELEQFFRRLGIFKERANNVMVVGASRMAYYLVKELSEMNMHVTVIDNNPARCQDMSEKSPVRSSFRAMAPTASCWRRKALLIWMPLWR